MHILIVDDVQDTRELFSMAFVLAGHRTATASSGAAALELVIKHRFDAILLDLKMQHVDGWKVLELIRQAPLGEKVPVILFSAHDNPDNEARARQSGAYMLLRKPMLPEYVLMIIEKAVSEYLA